MVGVAQYEGSIDIFEVLRRQGLDRGLRTHWRKDRSDEVAVRCGANPRAGAVIFGCDLK